MLALSIAPRGAKNPLPNIPDGFEAVRRDIVQESTKPCQCSFPAFPRHNPRKKRKPGKVTECLRECQHRQIFCRNFFWFCWFCWFFGSTARVFYPTDYADFFEGRAVRKSQVAGRGSTSLVATTQWLAIVRVKALLGCSTRRRGGWRASVPTSRLPLRGRMVSGSLAEHREILASLVRGQADACPSLRFASPVTSAEGR